MQCCDSGELAEIISSQDPPSPNLQSTVWTQLTKEGQLLSVGPRDMLLSTTAMEAMRCEGASQG